MLLSDKALIKRRGNKKLKHYEQLGYDTSKDLFEVNISDLTTSSKVNILVKCDICSNIVERPYYLYLKNISKYNIFCCSRKCANSKTKLTNLEKWGVEYINQSDIIKEKKKKTNLEKYGCEFPSQLEEIKKKTISTNLERYGEEYYTKTEEYLKSVKKTNLSKYENEWSIASNEIREKIKKTNLENLGVENPFLCEKIREKIKKTNLENLGVENPSQSEFIQLKKELTNLKKRGVKYPMQDPEVRDKSKKTLLNNYNIEHNSKSDSFKKSVSIKNKKNSEERKSKSKKTNLKKWGNEFITVSEKYRKENNILSKNKNYIKYQGKNYSLFKCDRNKDHNFEISSSNYFSRLYRGLPLCTVCNPIGDSQSIKEKELYEYIKSIYNVEFIKSYRDGLEIDVYLPDLKIGFEFNGLYWHSEEWKDKWYHINKTNYFKERGIRIIHIWEDDWNLRREIVKSQIRNWLGLTEGKIFARKCYVKEIVDSKIATRFLEENHIQGRVNSSLKLGLYYGEELVSLMTFDHYEGRNKMESGGWNINRFCNKINYSVVGGASKLFNYFIKNYEINRVISYSDSDWSSGDLYKNLGFNKISEGNPDYKYIFEGVRIHKSRFRKSRLNSNLTESEYMKKSHIFKIWDCGKIKWLFI
jgi:hypothetical protein